MAGLLGRGVEGRRDQGWRSGARPAGGPGPGPGNGGDGGGGGGLGAVCRHLCGIHCRERSGLLRAQTPLDITADRVRWV